MQSGRAPAHPFEQAIGATVEIVHGDDVAAAVEAIQQGRDGGEAGGEGIAALAAFQVGDAALVGHARRVLRAAVLVALVHPGTVLRSAERRVGKEGGSTLRSWW